VLRCRYLSAPAELGAIAPHPVQYHGQLVGNGHLGATHARALGDSNTPGLEGRPLDRTGEQHVGGFIKFLPCQAIALLADVPPPCRPRRTVAPWRQAEMDGWLESTEPQGIVDQAEGQCRRPPDAWRRRQPAADVILAHRCHHQTMRASPFGPHGINPAEGALFGQRRVTDDQPSLRTPDQPSTSCASKDQSSASSLAILAMRCCSCSWRPTPAAPPSAAGSCAHQGQAACANKAAPRSSASCAPSSPETAPTNGPSQPARTDVRHRRLHKATSHRRQPALTSKVFLDALHAH
jgi:hypothetical protein